MREPFSLDHSYSCFHLPNLLFLKNSFSVRPNVSAGQTETSSASLTPSATTDKARPPKLRWTALWRSESCGELGQAPQGLELFLKNICICRFCFDDYFVMFGSLFDITNMFVLLMLVDLSVVFSWGSLRWLAYIGALWGYDRSIHCSSRKDHNFQSWSYCNSWQLSQLANSFHDHNLV